jgi:fibronectin type 3 domain-containing protein
MKKQKIGLAVGIVCILLVAFVAYEILVISGFIQNKEVVSSEKLASDNPSQPTKSIPAQTSAVQPSQSGDIGTGKVTLTWDSVGDADSYNVYWSDKKGVSKRNGTKVPAVKNSATITGLKGGVTYYFVVTSVNESGESRESRELVYKVD